MHGFSFVNTVRRNTARRNTARRNVVWDARQGQAGVAEDDLPAVQVLMAVHSRSLELPAAFDSNCPTCDRTRKQRREGG